MRITLIHCVACLYADWNEDIEKCYQNICIGKHFLRGQKPCVPIMLKNSRYTLPSCVPTHFTFPLCYSLHTFFCRTFSSSFHHFIIFSSPMISLSSSSFNSYCSSFRSLPAYPSFFFPSSPPILLSQPLHHLLLAYLSPITLPSLLTSSFHLCAGAAAEMRLGCD